MIKHPVLIYLIEQDSINAKEFQFNDLQIIISGVLKRPSGQV